MGKDYSDYLLLVLGAGERVHTLKRIRQLKGDIQLRTVTINDHQYLFNRDRAYRIRGRMPLHLREPGKLRRTIHNYLRSKKIGLLVYQEPGKPVMVTVDFPVRWECMQDCGFSTESEPASKRHVTMKHKGIDYDSIMKVHTEEKSYMQAEKEPIEPMHISRKHQPSGRDKEKYPHAKKREKGDPAPSLLETISPRVLKAVLDSPQFRRAFNSFKFGNLTPITSKWWIWLAIVVVVIFVVLYLTGNFQTG